MFKEYFCILFQADSFPIPQKCLFFSWGHFHICKRVPEFKFNLSFIKKIKIANDWFYKLHFGHHFVDNIIHLLFTFSIYFDCDLHLQFIGHLNILWFCYITCFVTKMCLVITIIWLCYCWVLDHESMTIL